jgi:hypothetical protein
MLGGAVADVLFVFVRKDQGEAEALADMFDAAGFTIANNSESKAHGATVIIWSAAAIRSRAFLIAAQQAINHGDALIASLTTPPTRTEVGLTPTFNLSLWRRDTDDPLVDPLFFAVDRLVMAARARAAEVTEDGKEEAAVVVSPGDPVMDAPSIAPTIELTVSDVNPPDSAAPSNAGVSAPPLRARVAETKTVTRPASAEIVAEYTVPPAQKRRRKRYRSSLIGDGGGDRRRRARGEF